ncbi:MAG TPA: general secretion pathway protein GspE [Myxococcales bacterium]|jgi:hypothetical protein|nr:general secretion pathway protein GspE [Myxococcales bacterium]
MARRRLGELLLVRQVITQAQLDQGLTYQRQTGHRLGSALVALGFLTEQQLCAALAEAMGMRAVRMPPDELDWEALQTLRARFCEANDLFPLTLDSSSSARKTLTVAMADPLNLPAIEEIEFTTGVKVAPVIAPLSGIRAAIRHYYFKQQGMRPGEGSPTKASEQMTILRPGGREDVVSTATDDDLPILEGDAVRELTQRTELAELIREQAAQRKIKRSKATQVEDDLSYLFGVKTSSVNDQIEELESRFWALLRIMAKKGLITRDEFLRELAGKDEQ